MCSFSIFLLSSFTLKFLNYSHHVTIYYWQQDLVTILDKKNEVFGRYIEKKSFNHHNHNQPQHNDVLDDAQGRRCEMLSPTQMLTEEEQSESRMTKRKKK